MPVSIEEMLANTSLFKRVSRDHLHQVAGLVQVQNYDAGDVITNESDLGTGLYIIRSGQVDVILNRGQSDENVLATLGEGDFFGEMALLLERPRSATVVAKQPTECLSLLRWNFRDAAMNAPEVLWAMLEHVAERLANCDEQLGDLATH